jgi:t-SNARE complex subunit (syntaxin)
MLHRTVQDVSALVGEQGERLETAEVHIDAAADSVAAGNADLAVAQKYVSSYRKKCCAFWLLVVALAIVITVPLCLHYLGNPFTKK